MLANLFMHYAFDMCMKRSFPELPWCRYADDGLCGSRCRLRVAGLKDGPFHIRKKIKQKYGHRKTQTQDAEGWPRWLLRADSGHSLFGTGCRHRLFYSNPMATLAQKKKTIRLLARQLGDLSLDLF
jgi:hypothetical protein